MPLKKALLKGVVATALTLAFGATAQAAEKITILVGGIEKILYLPIKLADQLGYFKDEGIEVDLVSVQAGSVSDTGLLSGSAQVAVGAYDQPLHLQAQGKFVTSIVQLSASPQEVLLVSSAQAGKINQWGERESHGVSCLHTRGGSMSRS